MCKATRQRQSSTKRSAARLRLGNRGHFGWGNIYLSLWHQCKTRIAGAACESARCRSAESVDREAGQCPQCNCPLIIRCDKRHSIQSISDHTRRAAPNLPKTAATEEALTFMPIVLSTNMIVRQIRIGTLGSGTGAGALPNLASQAAGMQRSTSAAGSASASIHPRRPSGLHSAQHVKAAPRCWVAQPQRRRPIASRAGSSTSGAPTQQQPQGNITSSLADITVWAAS